MQMQTVFWNANNECIFAWKQNVSNVTSMLLNEVLSRMLVFD